MRLLGPSADLYGHSQQTPFLTHRTFGLLAQGEASRSTYLLLQVCPGMFSIVTGLYWVFQVSAPDEILHQEGKKKRGGWKLQNNHILYSSNGADKSNLYSISYAVAVLIGSNLVLKVPNNQFRCN